MADEVTIFSTTDTEEQIQQALDRNRSEADAAVEEEGTDESATETEEGEEGESEGTESEGESESEESEEEGESEEPEEGESEEEEDSDESEEGDDDDEDVDEEELDEQPRKRPSKEWRRRVNKLTAIRHQQQDEIDRLARENEALRAGRSPEQEQGAPKAPEFTEPKPKIDDYDTVEEWTEALAEWTERKIEFKTSNTSQAAARAQEQTRLFAAHAARSEAYRKANPDFDKARQRAINARVPITEVMTEHIVRSELGPEITYHLAVNQNECRRIAALPPALQLVALGEIQATLKRGTAKKTATPPVQKKKKKPTAPPPPIKPGKGGVTSVSQKDPSKMTFQEHKAWRARGGGRSR